MSACTRCKKQSIFFYQLKEYLSEIGYSLRMVTTNCEWCSACFERRYEGDHDIRIRVTFQYCSCDNAKLPRIPRLDGKYKVKVEVDEVSTDHGYSNSFTTDQDITQIDKSLEVELDRALDMFKGCDKEWREMMAETRTW